MTELPRWKCHKIVQAAKILEVREKRDGSPTMLILDTGESVELTRDMFNGVPEGTDISNGYLVVYEDGYVSWSPAKAFEDGYTKLPSDGFFLVAGRHGLVAISTGKGDDSEPRQTWVRADLYEAMVEALNFYGTGGGAVVSIDQAPLIEVPLAIKNMGNDCGAKARAVLNSLYGVASRDRA